MPTVSIVIPTYNRRPMVETVVRAALAQEGVFEVLVLVDGSTDGTAEALRALGDAAEVLRVEERPNSGLVGARIEGVKAARGDVVLLLDDDVVPAPGLAAGHARHHSVGERLVVLGYMPVPEENRRRGSFPTALYAIEYEGRTVGWERQESDLIASTFWAGNFSLRREDYLALIPTITARLPDVYHEDLGFARICAEAGLRFVFDRSLLASHRHERSVEAFMRDAQRAAEGRLRLIDAGLSQERGDPDYPLAGLRWDKAAIAKACAHEPMLKALLAAADLCNKVNATRASLWLGDLCWRAKQLRTTREGLAGT
jgi:glycosyltransferase involved in cell wall biosynthesis